MGGRANPFGLGPVFAYEWITASRRWQGYALRSLFVSFLLGSLIVVAQGRLGLRTVNTPTFKALADLGEMFFRGAVGTQLTLVLLAAPAATAGAICIDRARGTLTHLLVTDLSDREIVLGKLAARLVPILCLIACAFPLMSLLTLIGGVDPGALAGAFLVTIGVAVLGCGLALFFSLLVGKTHEALLATYAVWLVWLLGRYMIAGVNAVLGWSLWTPQNFSDPFILAYTPYDAPGSVGWADYFCFLGITCAISAVFVVLATVRLRAVCTRTEGPQKPRRRPRLPAPPVWTTRWFDAFGPSLDYNPVLWREWHRNRPSRWSRVVAVLFFVIAATFSLISVMIVPRGMGGVVNGFQVSIGLLLLSVTASTSLAEERARGSLDVLMTTTLTTRQIVLGKWFGTFRFVPMLAILPALVILFTGTNQAKWVGAVVMTLYIHATGAAITSLGLALATWCKRLGRAVGLSVTAFVLMTVGWMFLVMSFMSPNPAGIGTITGSPFYGTLVITMTHTPGGFGPGHRDSWGTSFWIPAYSLVAAGLLAATLGTFNRCLGRVDTGLGLTERETRKLFKSELVTVGAGLE